MKNVGVKYGLICGLVVVIAQLAGNLLEIQSMGRGAGLLSWFLVFAITFALVFAACKEFREENGNITVGEGLKIGVTCGLLAGLIGGVFGILYTQVIDPEFTERMMETMRDAWEEQGMTDEQITQAEKMTSMFVNPIWSVPVAIIWYVIGGLIKGPIAGAILRRSE